MTEPRCLLCYDELEADSGDIHARCARRLYGKGPIPQLDVSLDQVQTLAEQAVRARITVPGAQAKLSLGLAGGGSTRAPRRLTLVDAPAGYILKPPSPDFPFLPELEDLSMHLTRLAGIPCVPHGLVRLASGEFAYLTRRIDRQNGTKLHMEDMGQLGGKPTEAKYRGSHEQVARLLQRFSAQPGLDLIRLYEQVHVAFLLGNSDLHLKNLSLLKDPQRSWLLSPAYDMVATRLVLETDPDELALTLNGKRSRLDHGDFLAAMATSGLEPKAAHNLQRRVAHALPGWHTMIDRSFLPAELRLRFHALITERSARLGIGGQTE